MISHKSKYYLLLIGLALFFLSMIVQVQRRLNQIRKVNQLTEVHPLKNAPPTVAFTTVALGGFRGLVCDILFLRLQALQAREQYFEIAQMASWIVKLQPRFTGVTAFLAWNMAYNISVLFENPEDRWRWVRNGIELLRDQSLELNPGDPSLYRELGWLYQHKIGQGLDDAHIFYKIKLAKDVIKILGEGPEYDWETLAKYAISQEKFFKELGDDKGKLLLILKKYHLTLKKLELEFREKGEFLPALKKELLERNLMSTLDSYFRAKWLRESLKLDPKIIRSMTQKYGYLDFRLPEAHAIYWATLGLKNADGNKDLGCERMIFQSLNNAFVSGKLMYFNEESSFLTSPNVKIVDAVRDSYLNALKNYKPSNSIIAGYENFMINAIVVLYLFDEKKHAKKFLTIMRRTGFLRNTKRYHVPLDEFVLSELGGDISTMSANDAQALIQALVIQSYKCLALKEYTRANGFEMLAARIYKKFMADKLSEKDKIRRGLPNYRVLKNQCKIQFNNIYPKSISELLENEMKMLQESQ